MTPLHIRKDHRQLWIETALHSLRSASITRLFVYVHSVQLILERAMATREIQPLLKVTHKQFITDLGEEVHSHSHEMTDNSPEAGIDILSNLILARL